MVDSEAYLLTCMRYIELNPVRANMVAHPGEYRWSSYAFNAQGRDNALLTPHPIDCQLGTTPEIRHHTYRELFRHDMENTLLHEIRDALTKNWFWAAMTSKTESQK